MTAVDVAALEAARAAATTGPWQVEQGWDRGQAAIYAPRPGVLATLAMKAANAAYIAAMHNALPDLLAAVRERDALRAAVERLTQAAPVMRFDNGYPVNAVPVSDLLSILAAVGGGQR